MRHSAGECLARAATTTRYVHGYVIAARVGVGLQLLCQPRKRPMDVAALIEASGFSQAPISRQLGQLQRAGLLRCKRDGVRTRLNLRLDIQLAQLQSA
jgi:DNA-binding IclR family transcriptional regulator